MVSKNFYVTYLFTLVKQWEQDNLVEYEDKSWMSSSNGERGHFHRTVFPPIPSPFEVYQNTLLAI